MPFQDSELDKLASERDRGYSKLAEKRAALDSASNERSRLQGAYGYRLDYLKTRIPELKTNIDYAYEQSRSCFEAHDGAGAKSWSDQAKALRGERSEAFDEKNRMIEELKEASTHFQAALADYRETKREAEAARDAFFKRLNHLKEESAKERTRREEERRKQRQQRLLGAGKTPRLLGPGSQQEREWWFKYGKATFDKDTKLDQMNFFAGYVGEKSDRLKVHIAVDERGDIVFIRDVTGDTLYDRKRGIGKLPPDLDFSK